ncbi:MAG: glycosyltransferase family 4 protein [Chloroflexi bacterium]|nr:glycosyltransferase family 4 protein [Chloroflexota bacterium]
MKCSIVINDVLPPAIPSESSDGEGPRKDYRLLVDALGAEIISRRPSGIFRHRFLSMLALAWKAFARRREYDVVLTMSEQVGLLIALLFKIARINKSHVMVTHYLTPRKKSLFVRWLHVDTHISRFICYGSTHARYLIEELGISEDKVSVVLHPADASFWKPMTAPTRKMIVSAGLMERDYETLLKAIDDIDADVVIAAASPWVNGGYEQSRVKVPDKVKFVNCATPEKMRDLYAQASLVVVPLRPVNMQAGSLVIYESMAMGKAVVATANGGNVDIIEDGETGYYVPPEDHEALRDVICSLLDNPEETKRTGEMARKTVEKGLNLDTYVQKVSAIMSQEFERGSRGSQDAAAQGYRSNGSKARG